MREQPADSGALGSLAQSSNLASLALERTEDENQFFKIGAYEVSRECSEEPPLPELTDYRLFQAIVGNFVSRLSPATMLILLYHRSNMKSASKTSCEATARRPPLRQTISAIALVSHRQRIMSSTTNRSESE